MSSFCLFGQKDQAFVAEKLASVKTVGIPLTFSMKFINRGSVSYGDVCSIMIRQSEPNDTILSFTFMRSAFDTLYPMMCGVVSYQLQQELIALETRYQKQKKDFEGWTSYWEIEVEHLKKRKKIRCRNVDFDRIIQIVGS